MGNWRGEENWRGVENFGDERAGAEGVVVRV